MKNIMQSKTTWKIFILPQNIFSVTNKKAQS